MMVRHFHIALLLVFILSPAVWAKRAPLPARVFSDHMVLQCEQPFAVWGDRALPGEPLIVVLGNQRKSTEADADGNWRVIFDPMPASSKPKTMLITSRRPDRGDYQVNDILIGEVWFCTGQSNMYVRLRPGQVEGAEAAIAAANHPQIRMSFNQKPWEAITPENVTEHSAVAYFAAKELHEQLDKPIGIITLAAGGRALQTFFKLDQFNRDPENAEIVELWKNEPEDAGRDPVYRPFLRPGGMSSQFLESVYGYGIRGVFWYQGEAEAARDWAPRYYRLFPQLIETWRELWDQPDMPFYTVQLPAYGPKPQDPGAKSTWAEVRDALAPDVPHTGYAVTYDLDDPDLHPKLKQPIGQRLARVALELTYNQPVSGVSPRIDAITRKGRLLELSFAHLKSGLKVKGNTVNGFALSDSDGRWKWVEARVMGDTVLVSTEGVSNPTRLRYAWADNPNGNLFSEEGLPVAPFQGPIR